MIQLKLNTIQNFAPNSDIDSVTTFLGGSSADMRLITLQKQNGAKTKIVARHHRRIEQESQLLSWLHSAGITSPEPLYFDPEYRILFLSFIDGESRYDLVEKSEIGQQIGAQLAKIHSLPLTADMRATLPTHPTELWPTNHARTEAEIRAVLEPQWPMATSEPPVFIHGDFWPGNMLWKEDTLVGVIDWEDAKLGNRLQDLAITRFDCCFTFGRSTMEWLTAEYGRLMPFNERELALWDLYSSLRAAASIPDWALGYPELGRPDLTEEKIWETHRWFLDQSLDKLV